MEQKRVMLSVVDVESKYTIDPAETVNGSSGIVSWGADNALAKLLATCYEKSATLKAAIDQSVNYVCGDEVVVSEEAALWKEQINRRKQDMDTLVNHITYDYYIYGNFAIQVIFNKLGMPVEMYPLDVSKCRLNEARDKVYYSKKGWTKYQTKSEEYGRFGYADFDPEHPTQIYFFNGAGVRKTYNPAPWAAALDDVLTEVEGSRYSLNSVTNGFAARYIIDIPDSSNLTDEQKEVIEDGIRNKFCGYDAESNFMIYYGNDEGKSLTVTKIEVDESPEKFQTIREGAKTNIFTSLRISPLLCGMGSEKTGFSTQEFSDSYKLFDRTVASPVRKIVTDSINDIIGIKDGVKIVPFTITFDNATD